MDILKDKAIVLKKKNVNESNVVVTLFTKNYGKLNAIVYGVRASNKREKIAINPMSYIEIEIQKKMDSYVLSSHTLYKNFKSIYKNLEKMEISYYILLVLNEIIEYNQIEEEIFERIEGIFEFLENLDVLVFKDNEYVYKFLTRFLRRLIIDFGIYSKTLLEDKEENYEKKLKKYEKYINSYFNTEVDYTKILIRR